MLKIFRIINCCLLLLISHFALAQTIDKFGAWNVLNIKLNLNKKWSVFSEFQLRSQLFYNDFYYYEIKGGASYKINNRFSLLMGFGKFVTYTEGYNFEKPFVNQEWRTWEQVVMNDHISLVKVENRIRIEQRWTSNQGYRNRFKYRLNLTVPLTNKKIIPGTFFINGWNEFYFTDSDPHFEQNRAYVGCGYEVSRHMTVQSGYLHQLSYLAGDIHLVKNYLQVSVLLEMSTHKEYHEKSHAGVD